MSMNDLPKVSVITPTYNHEKFIGPCIESVIQQSYQNWEQIIIDDGSTDRTAEIVHSYTDRRIRYFHQENQGIEALAQTYNRALRQSRGEFIGILEGDDLWPPNKLASLVPAFQDVETILAYGIPREVNSTGIVSPSLPKQVRRRLRLPRSILFNDPVGSATGFMLRTDGHELVAPSTVVIRRTALHAIGGFQSIRGLGTTDFPTFVKLSAVGRFSFCREVMGYRRRHPNSAVFQNLDRMSAALPNALAQTLAEVGSSLASCERAAIEKTWETARFVAEFTHGRMHALRGQWPEARKHFLTSMHTSEPRILAAALTGWILSWFRQDLEGLIRLAGRSELKG